MQTLSHTAHPVPAEPWRNTLADACLDTPTRAGAQGLPSPVALQAPLLQALARRRRRLQARGLTLQLTLDPVRVRVDAPRLQALLLTLLDWAIDEAALTLQMRITPAAWPPVCELRLRLARCAQDAGTLLQQAIAWQLVQRQAQRLGLALRRVDTPTQCSVMLELPQVLRPALGEQGPACVQDARALAGRHVLVVSSRRELRAQVRELLQPLGVLVDGAADAVDAANLCADMRPCALVVEAALMAGLLTRLHRQPAATKRAVLLQVDETGTDLICAAADAPLQLGREALSCALPDVLMLLQASAAVDSPTLRA
jgi:CheY-like chemotaxis protein